MDDTNITDLSTLRASTKAVLTREEVATVLGVDVRTVSRAAANGELPALRVGRRILIPRERFLAILTEDQAA